MSECDGCFRPVEKCCGYGDCTPRLKRELSAAQEALQTSQGIRVRLDIEVHAFKERAEKAEAALAEQSNTIRQQAIDRDAAESRLALALKVVEAARTCERFCLRDGPRGCKNLREAFEAYDKATLDAAPGMTEPKEKTCFFCHKPWVTCDTDGCLTDKPAPTSPEAGEPKP